MKKGTVISIIVVVLLIIAGVVIAKSSSQTQQLATAGTTETTSDDDAMDMQASTSSPVSDTQNAQLSAGSADHAPTNLSFDVTTGSFYFTPNVIHVKKGDTVTINVTNAGGVHNFELDEFNVKTSIIGSGKTMKITFVADKTGTFEFYCGIGDHRAKGQKGTLIVE